MRSVITLGLILISAALLAAGACWAYERWMGRGNAGDAEDAEDGADDGGKGDGGPQTAGEAGYGAGGRSPFEGMVPGAQPKVELPRPPGASGDLAEAVREELSRLQNEEEGGGPQTAGEAEYEAAARDRAEAQPADRAEAEAVQSSPAGETPGAPGGGDTPEAWEGAVSEIKEGREERTRHLGEDDGSESGETGPDGPPKGGDR